MKLKFIAIVILSLLLVSCCKDITKPESVVMIKDNHVVTKSDSTSDKATIYRYIIVDPTCNTLVQVKKVKWNGGGEPTYTVVVGIGNASGFIPIDTEAYWGSEALRPEYLKQQYYEDTNVPFGNELMFLSGVEIIFKDRYQLQALNLSGNTIYMDFNAGRVCMFRLPYNLWKDALDYILYQGE